MNLADYLEARCIKRTTFASQIGVSQSYVTMLCQQTVWPSHDVMVRIMHESGGAVTPNDFIKTMPADALDSTTTSLESVEEGEPHAGCHPLFLRRKAAREHTRRLGQNFLARIDDTKRDK